MLIVVTGATGFIGGRLVRHLSAAGHAVLAFGRRPDPGFDASHVTYRRWDIATGPIDVEDEIDAVVHCAAMVADRGTFEEQYAADVVGTRAVLETFERAPLFIHMSTASVYDPRQPKHHVQEDAPLSSRYLNAYSHTKMLAERAVEESGRPTTILRPHIVYGPGDPLLLPGLLRARRFGRLWAAGDGTNRVSLTHIENLLHAIDCALQQRSAPGIFNIADAADATVDDLLRAILNALDMPARITYVPAAIAWHAGHLLEIAHRVWRCEHSPMLTRYLVAQMAH
jgi:nucleoside-diphosphate-sugar epimerase